MPVLALNPSRTAWKAVSSLPPHRDVTVMDPLPPAAAELPAPVLAAGGFDAVPPPVLGAGVPPPPPAGAMRAAAIGRGRKSGDFGLCPFPPSYVPAPPACPPSF